ncbi:MAG: thiamine phosphate synthase, partial [Pedobacter sp.]
MKKFIEKLHFITHDIQQLSHIEQAQIACESGAKWIQYRCLTKSDDELLTDINVIAEICDDWGATLIVTDHVHLKGKADIQGFHIE